MLETPEAAPTLLSTDAEFVDECKHGVTGHTAAGPVGAVPDGSEDRLDRIARAQMHPVLGGKVVESQQGIAILSRFTVIGLSLLDRPGRTNLSNPPGGICGRSGHHQSPANRSEAALNP